MSVVPTTSRTGAAGRGLAVASAIVALAACSGSSPPTTRRLHDGSRLIQKGQYQALYGPAGRLERVLNDNDGDGTAEAIVFYRHDGRPERSELDTDGDHTVDRWERLRPDGTVLVSARSRQRDGRPDVWVYLDEDGLVYRTDFDDDGDGEPDRTEHGR